MPDTDDRDVYLVLDDVGRHGRCWRETDEEGTDRKTIVQDLLDGHHNPARVITFNTAEGWSRDVSEEIAGELRASICAAGPPIKSDIFGN